MTTKAAQTIQILEYMRAGNSITPLYALRLFGRMRLGARIYDLRQSGYEISATIVNDDRTGKRFARYFLN